MITCSSSNTTETSVTKGRHKHGNRWERERYEERDNELDNCNCHCVWQEVEEQLNRPWLWFHTWVDTGITTKQKILALHPFSFLSFSTCTVLSGCSIQVCKLYSFRGTRRHTRIATTEKERDAKDNQNKEWRKDLSLFSLTRTLFSLSHYFVHRVMTVWLWWLHALQDSMIHHHIHPLISFYLSWRDTCPVSEGNELDRIKCQDIISPFCFWEEIERNRQSNWVQPMISQSKGLIHLLLISWR